MLEIHEAPCSLHENEYLTNYNFNGIKMIFVLFKQSKYNLVFIIAVMEPYMNYMTLWLSLRMHSNVLSGLPIWASPNLTWIEQKEVLNVTRR